MDLSRVNPIVNTKYVKPQEHWGWPIAVYLYSAGMGAGSFIIGAIMDWLGYAAYPSKAVLLWGALLVAFGAPFLILDLGIKWRFLNACLNPRTSWVARGFLILSAFIVVGITALGVSLLPLLGIEIASGVLQILEGIGIVLAFTTAIYTGILLKAIKYVTLWNTWLLPLLFLASALSTGSMVIILSTLVAGLLAPQGDASQLMEMLMRTEQVLILVEGLVLGLFLLFGYRTKEQGERSVRLLLTGNLKFVFWIGIVVSGFFFPIILENMYSPELPFLPFLTGLFLLMGGFFLRFGILHAGIKETPPLTKLIVIQYPLGNMQNITDSPDV
jgi:formate-dependent nitrite reductase membrane component NrfD